MKTVLRTLHNSIHIFMISWIPCHRGGLGSFKVGIVWYRVSRHKNLLMFLSLVQLSAIVFNFVWVSNYVVWRMENYFFQKKKNVDLSNSKAFTDNNLQVAWTISGFDRIGNIVDKGENDHALKCFNPFPDNDAFWRPWETSLWKTLWEKEKLLVSNFSFSHRVF